ncbi:MAG TPA: spore cortex-lytic enzyme [Candidatus Faecaligallichristensenella faecipullorum]|nr:spore cortex-lytic enzyme [Candidatus Faecaligallichristensenella faecipullorum]
MKKNLYRINRILLFAAMLAMLLYPMMAQAATVLEVGSRGDDVVKVQKRLIQYDYLDGTADGKFGADTLAAVKLFQRRNGLTVDGKVGPATAAALGVTLSGSSSASSSSSSSSRGGSSDLNLLARVVHGEARGEPYKGKVAVAAVVLNRVESSSFPNTIAGVVYQSGAFSAVSDGQINLTPDSESIRAAQDALNGWDPTGGCLYYYNPNTATDSWIRTRTVKTVIGRHYFCV